ncbi:hypothetical protein C8Q78DRAFT_1048492 [Trametes maxima]|nr:hypothetical protein C8Q78DRAFT_1048492 [Trametes maxima]
MDRFSNTEQNAIHNLDILPTFSSVQRLHHGIHNDLSDWVARGFRELVHSRPIDELTMQEVELIGLPAYFAITRAKHRLFEHRLLVSFWTPEVVTVAACKRPRTCEEIWQREWWSGFAKRALQPDSDTEFSLETALNALDAPELMVAMCVECKKESVLAVKQSGCLADYRAIIEEELSLIS